MPKTDYGAGTSGALTGALSGASIGSAIPVIGTAIGAGLGGIFGAAGGLFGGRKKKKAKKRSTLDPQQQALYKDYVDSLRNEGPFKDLYNFDAAGYNDVFDKTIARAANRNYSENIIPGITGQFRSNNIMNSSYTGEALSRAGRDVQENLDALRSQNIFQGQQQANQNKQNAINNILGMQTFAYDKPGPQNPSMIDQVLGTLGPAAGEWFADYLKKGNKTPAAPATAPAPSPVV